MPTSRKRKKSRRMAASGAAVLTLLLVGQEQFDSSAVRPCGGSDRWAVKVMIDPGADSLEKFITETTIGQIKDNEDINTRDTFKFGKKRSRMSIEKKVVRIRHCRIVDILRERDKDYHLVITDRKGDSMIVEAPDVLCEDASESKWAENFNRVRLTIKKHRKDYREHKFTITGPLFVDKLHGAKGAAPNGIEIHPILDLQVE